jgi:hypothetical protein
MSIDLKLRLALIVASVGIGVAAMILSAHGVTLPLDGGDPIGWGPPI